MDLLDYQEQKDSPEEHFWHKAKAELVDIILARYFSSKDKNRNIIDIGCGTGDELKVLKRYGSVTALDKNTEVLKLASTSGAKTIEADISLKQLDKNNYDAICCFDILEHIKNDGGVLNNLYAGLKPGGQIFITVPAYKNLYGPHDMALEHVRRYSKKELREKLSQAGFKNISITYWNFLLFPLEAMYRLIKKAAYFIRPQKNYRSETHDIPEPINTILRIFNPILYLVLSLDNKLIKKGLPLPYGLTLVAICKK
jgi:2-polyprenyl-3-methyl-5-hydroxy-6-metoxy-1,4-benzoquinol methylase